MSDKTLTLGGFGGLQEPSCLAASPYLHLPDGAAELSAPAAVAASFVRSHETDGVRDMRSFCIYGSVC
jgi:hypothetical protein